MSAIQRTIRSIQTAVECPRLTRFSLHPPKSVEVEFANSSVYNLSAEFLRIHSPAADSKVRSVGGEKDCHGSVEFKRDICRSIQFTIDQSCLGFLFRLVIRIVMLYEKDVPSGKTEVSFPFGNYYIWTRKVIFGRRHVGIMSAEPIGNYGVRILFDDLHKTGIYTWDFFYHLGSNKLTLMRNYIKTLKKHGLSRDPPRRK